LLDPGSVFFGFSYFAAKGSGPLGISAPVAFGCRIALSDPAFPRFFNQCDEPIEGQLPVSILGARFLDRHRKARRPMDKGYGGGDLVDILAARSA